MPASATIALTEILARSAVDSRRCPASSSALRPGSGDLIAVPPSCPQMALREAGLGTYHFASLSRRSGRCTVQDDRPVGQLLGKELPCRLSKPGRAGLPMPN